MHKTLLPLVFLLGACGKDLSDEDLQAVFNAADEVSREASTDAIAAPAMGAQSSVQVKETGEGDYSLHGTIEGTAGWTGSVTVDGEMTTDPSGTGSITLDITYASVEVDGYILDGTCSTALDYDTAGFDSSVTGDLEVTGEAEGSVTFDYELSATYNPVTVTYTGTVNGEDIADITGS